MLSSKYQNKKACIENFIHDCQERLDDKETKLTIKQQELDSLLKDIQNIHSVNRPFKNYKIEINASQITEKPPMFGTDKWLERQNTIIEKQFTAMGRKLEELYRNEAANQVETVRQNILVDMKEVHTLKAENKTLTECMNYWSNLALKTFDYLSIQSLRDGLCAVATALIGGDYLVPSGGGGGGNESDLRWDGRRPDEPDFAFQRRCFSHTVKYIMAKYSVKQNKGRAR